MVGRVDLFDPAYLEAQAARHAKWLRAAGVRMSGHGVACLTRVPGWPSTETPSNHLAQTCPCCGLTEARGDYCTRCRCRTGPADWHDRELSAAKRAALAAGRAIRHAGPRKTPRPTSPRATAR